MGELDYSAFLSLLLMIDTVLEVEVGFPLVCFVGIGPHVRLIILPKSERVRGLVGEDRVAGDALSFVCNNNSSTTESDLRPSRQGPQEEI